MAAAALAHGAGVVPRGNANDGVYSQARAHAILTRELPNPDAIAIPQIHDELFDLC